MTEEEIDRLAKLYHRLKPILVQQRGSTRAALKVCFITPQPEPTFEGFLSWYKWRLQQQQRAKEVLSHKENQNPSLEWWRAYG